LNEFIAIAMIIVIIIIVVSVSEKKPPPKKEEEKKEEEKKEVKEVKKFEVQYMDKIAIELIKGGDPDEITEREGAGITKDDINQWKEDFLKDIETYAKNRREIYSNIGQLENDIKWFENVCKENIGEDWKEKTGYYKRKR